MLNLLKLMLLAAIAAGGYWLYQDRNTINANDYDWTAYAFKMLPAQASFPATPQIDVLDVQGHSMEGASSNTADWSLSVFTMRGQQVMLYNHQPERLQGKGFKVDSQQEIIVDGHQGTEFRLSNSKRLAVQRFIRVNDTLVLQTATYRRENVDDEFVATFIQSLDL